MKNCLNLNFQEPFYSEGLLLNYHGTVYCPYVCNYPIHIRKSAKHVAPNREDRCYPRIGDWISFRAKFDPSTQRYEINEVNGVKMRKKFKYMKLPGEKDTYAVKFLKIFFYHFLVPNPSGTELQPLQERLGKFRRQHRFGGGC